MIRLTKIPPNEALAGDIDFYWYMEKDGHDSVEGQLFPSLSAEIIFNISFSTIFFESDGHFEKAPHLEVVGGLSKVMRVSTSEPIKLLGVRFFPHTIKYFLNEEMSVLKGSLSAADLVAGCWIRSLQDRLLSLFTLPEKIQNLNEFFSQRLSATAGNRDSFFHFFGSLYKSKELISVDRIVKKLGYSSRYTEKIFQRQVGISPQEYLQIGRLHRAVKLMKDAETPLTKIAYECGFADQSHFTRTFKGLTGQTPLQYRKGETAINLL
jgi:AraC-like DNA-binding protein